MQIVPTMLQNQFDSCPDRIKCSVKMDTTMTMDEIRKMISGEHRKTSVQIEEPTWNLDDWDDGEEEYNSKVLL